MKQTWEEKKEIRREKKNFLTDTAWVLIRVTTPRVEYYFKSGQTVAVSCEGCKCFQHNMSYIMQGSKILFLRSHQIILPIGLSLNRSFFKVCCAVSGLTILSTISQSCSNALLWPCNLFSIFLVLVQTLRISLKTLHHTLVLKSRHQIWHCGHCP